MHLILTMMLALADPGMAAHDSGPIPAPKTSAEVAALNKDLSPDDARYIRCRQVNATGSLVKKTRVCQSNAQWRRTVEAGNRTARETVEHNARAWSNGD